MASISVSLSGAAASESTAPIFRSFPDSVRFAFGVESQLVFNIVTGGREIMPLSAVTLLQSCAEFATLEEHLNKLAARFQVPSVEIPALRANLNQFVQIGLLVSRQQLVNECLTGNASSPAKITTVGVPTCNRPDNLYACLESLVASKNQSGRDMNFLVADDSPDEAVRALNIERLQAIKKQCGVGVLYMGKEEKQKLAEALANESGMPRSVVDFAILNPENCPISTGANRNTLLLSTVGQAILQCDDDVICRGAQVPGANANLTISSQYDPQEVWFDEALINSQSWPIVDVFSLHERMLGRSVAECLGLATDELKLEAAHAIFFRRLKPTGGRVLVTALGTAGDSGMGLSTQFLLYDDAERARLMQSEQFYRHASESHRQLRGVVNPTISDAAFCMTMNSGLDNRALLPPFMPVQRNQDGIFGRLLRATIYDALFGFIPWTVVHHKTGSVKREADGGRIRMANICFMLVNSEAAKHFHCKESDKNLQDIGLALMDIGSLPLNEFEERLLLTFWKLHGSRVSELQSLLQKYGSQPAYWANDVITYIRDLENSVCHAKYVVASDLAAVFGDETARVMAPRLIYRFGELLTCWAQLRQAAGLLPSFARQI